MGARIDGQAVTFKTSDEITALLQDRYKHAGVSIKNFDYKSSFNDAGVDPDERAGANKAVDWPWWQRLIPLSSVVKAFNNHQRTPLQQNSAAQSTWAQLVLQACNQPAVNAGIKTNDDGTLELQPSKDGRLCDAKTILRNLNDTQLSQSMMVDVSPQTVKPTRSNVMVEDKLTIIRPIVKAGITVKANDKTTMADAKTIVKWLTFTDEKDGKLIVDVDLKQMQGFIEQAQSSVYIAPGTTYINVRDGAETSRTSGSNGQGIDQAQLAKDIREIFVSQQNKPLQAKVIALAPREVFNRSYSNSAAGLQALLNQLAKDKGDVAIAITELDGQRRSLSVNGGKQYHPASTYKLVIAYSVIKRVEANQMKWSDQIASKSVDDCLTSMIVDSDNTCAEAFGKQISWSSVQNDVRSLGMNSTNYESSNFVSTVNDQALFLAKLQNAQLMKNENKDKLLELMKRQRYRSGIPAGVGVPVADKVGFLGSLLHDSAIVYGSSGTYVLSVYSSGGSWGNIADIAHQINNLMQ